MTTNTHPANSTNAAAFLARMSHELRTPLNSVLLLARLLAENEERTLTDKQVQYARTICAAGEDLLALVNEVLDLSRIEAGHVEILPGVVRLEDVRDDVERTFREVAQDKKLSFAVRLAPDAPETIVTDGRRLQQILKNLLANAFKFTAEGGVSLDVHPAGDALAFAVADTGIGIPEDRQQIVFEAFQQADPSVARTYGGTGLGLTICRELGRLLGAEIDLVSAVGRGSTFTLRLPVAPPRR